MKKFLSTLLLSTFTVLLLAQSAAIGWQKKYSGNGNDKHSFDDVILDGDFVVATGRVYNNNDYRILMAKFDQNGNEIWATFSGLNGLDLYSYYVQKGSDGNYYVMGYASSGEIFIAKFNSSNGNSEGLTALSSSSLSECNDFKVLPDGSFIVAGGSNDKPYLLKLDKDLNEIWAKEINFSFTQGFQDGPLYSVSLIPGIGYYVLTPGKSLFSSTSSGDVIVAKVDLEGDLIWQKAFGGAGGEDFADSYATGSRSSIETHPDGGFVFSVHTRSNEFNTAGTASTRETWTLKGTSDGQQSWWATSGSIGANFPNGLEVKPNGNILVYGRGLYNSNDQIFNITADKGSVAFVYELNKANGNKVWDNCFGGTNSDVVRKCVATSNSKFYAVGTFGQSSSEEFAWLFSVNISGVSANNDLETLNKSIFPNPATDFLKIGFETIQSGTAFVFDMTGKVQLTHTFSGQSDCLLDIAALPAGTYLLQLIHENGAVSTGKFSKIR